MSKDVMTAEERLQASIELKPVDRVACSPWISEYAGRFAGITNKEFFADWDKKMAALKKVKEAYPMWDINREGSAALTYDTRALWPMAAKLPGFELDDNAPRQMLEIESTTREDLTIVKEQGFMPFYVNSYCKLHGLRPDELFAKFGLAGQLGGSEAENANKLGQTIYFGSYGPGSPFELLGFFRAIQKLFKDVHQVPDLLDEIFPIINKGLLELAIGQIKASGSKRAFVAGTRCGPSFISKKNFDRFCGPYYKEYVAGLIENGITPAFHFDGDWTDYLEFFLEFPKGKCVLELDSTTDIFKAKEILKDHMCILGDVSPILFTLASASEMDEYCKKLFKVVGKDNGFIMAAGCTMPFNSKHENVKVFFESVEKYGRYN